MKLAPRQKMLRRRRANESGAVLIWVTVLIAVLFGLAGLAIDASRYFNLNSNLQEIADAAALAGAKELDGSQDAITRAKNAARYFLSNNPRWSDDGLNSVQIVETGPDAPVVSETLNGPAVTDPKKAAFIRVTTITRSVTPTFASLVLGDSKPKTRAQATAKVSYSVCAQIQSFICNAFETEPGYVPGAASNWKDMAGVSKGDMFVLSGSVGGPGSWGFVYPGSNSAQATREFWAKETSTTCTDLSPGQYSGQVDTGNNAGQWGSPGMNVRFGNPISPAVGTAAPIVIDGYKKTTSGPCSNTVDAMPTGFPAANGTANYATICNNPANRNVKSCPLPRSRNMSTTGHSWTTLVSGGKAHPDDLQAYWYNQHGTAAFPAGATTRYELYLAEVAALSTQPASFWSTAENHQASCSGTPNSTDPKRRVITVAVVDCNYWSINGASNPLPLVTTTAQFFMTEAATDQFNGYNPSNRGRLYVEYIDSFYANQAGGAVYQNVRLVQ